MHGVLSQGQLLEKVVRLEHHIPRAGAGQPAGLIHLSCRRVWSDENPNVHECIQLHRRKPDTRWKLWFPDIHRVSGNIGFPCLVAWIGLGVTPPSFDQEAARFGMDAAIWITVWPSFSHNSSAPPKEKAANDSTLEVCPYSDPFLGRCSKESKSKSPKLLHSG